MESPVRRTSPSLVDSSLLVGVAIVLTLSGCVSGGAVPDDNHHPRGADDHSWDGDDRAVTATLLTYNVAGLPDVFSGSHPSVNHPMISPRLNTFDIVLVQEDFWYHEKLSAEVTLPFSSHPTRKGVFRVGDGLNRFSSSPFEVYSRYTWAKRYGVFGHSNDRLAPKGFTVATHHISGLIEVDIYNLHMDAGGSHNDYLAREAQIAQLSEVLQERSDGRPVIVAGDWNLKSSRPDDRELLARFMQRFALQDAREVQSAAQDRIDRVLYRSGDGVEVMPLAYAVESTFFRDPDGAPLSDHEAVSVAFIFQVAP